MLKSKIKFKKYIFLIHFFFKKKTIATRIPGPPLVKSKPCRGSSDVAVKQLTFSIPPNKEIVRKKARK
jgi:hypothetical protein